MLKRTIVSCALVCASACNFGPTSSSTGNPSTFDPKANSPSGSGSVTDSDGTAFTCYSASRTGCQDLSWSSVVSLIDGLYAKGGTYEGYTKKEALDLAKKVYDQGVVPEQGLAAVLVESVDGGASKLVVSVRDATGHPVKGLSADKFTFEAGSATTSPASVKRVGDASADDVRLRFSSVLDDSGSISDCDAQFVADGVSTLIEAMPPIYESELLKFSDEVETLTPFTSSAKLLSDSARNKCTSRQSTALWDGAVKGIEDVSAAKQKGELAFVVVFSDGFENSSTHTLSDVAVAARAQKIPVWAIGIGIADPFALTNLARETGGGFAYVPSGARVVDAFKTASSYINESYILTIPASEVPPTKLHVMLDGGTVLTVDVPK